MKAKASKVDITPDTNKEESFTMPRAVLSDIEPGIQIMATYDASENLVKISFEKNTSLPRVLFKIIGLIIQFQCYLNAISINRGLDQFCVYEIGKFLPLSKITDLCLDNCFVEQGNYYLLLEQTSCLRHLSLARCNINDVVIERIAASLTYPLPSSKTLSILNLASNKITDTGAKFLADILRSNRQLSYLNLSDNMLTDVGAEHLLNTLLRFPLSLCELLSSRSRLMTYLKEKNEMILRLVKELRVGDFEKRTAKRKSVGAGKVMQTPKKKGLEKELSLKSVPEAKSIPNIEGLYLDKATSMAESILGEFKDPFDKENTLVIDGVVYSQGNNFLSYLSLAYNNLSYVTVKKLLKVVLYQKEMGRKPRGLVNVSIEGNLMPVACKELLQIDDLLEMGLMVHDRRFSLTPKKRGQSKTGTPGTR